jgi:hypothetical protein
LHPRFTPVLLVGYWFFFNIHRVGYHYLFIFIYTQDIKY